MSEQPSFVHDTEDHRAGVDHHDALVSATNDLSRRIDAHDVEHVPDEGRYMDGRTHERGVHQREVVDEISRVACNDVAPSVDLQSLDYVQDDGLSREEKLANAQAWIDTHMPRTEEKIFGDTVVRYDTSVLTADDTLAEGLLDPSEAPEVAELLLGIAKYDDSHRYVIQDNIRKIVERADTISPQCFSALFDAEQYDVLEANSSKLQIDINDIERLYDQKPRTYTPMHNKIDVVLGNGPEFFQVVAEHAPGLLDDEMRDAVLLRRNIQSNYRQNDPANYEIDHVIVKTLSRDDTPSVIREWVQGLVSDHPEAEAKRLQFIVDHQCYDDEDKRERYSKGVERATTLSGQNAYEADRMLDDLSLSGDLKANIKHFSPDTRQALSALEHSLAIHSSRDRIRDALYRMFTSGGHFSREGVDNLSRIEAYLNEYEQSDLAGSFPSAKKLVIGRVYNELHTEQDWEEFRCRMNALDTRQMVQLIGQGAIFEFMQSDLIQALMRDESILENGQVSSNFYASIEQLERGSEDAEFHASMSSFESMQQLISARIAACIGNPAEVNDLVRRVGELNDEELVGLIGENGPFAFMQRQYTDLILRGGISTEQLVEALSRLSDGQSALWKMNMTYADMILNSENSQRGHFENGASTSYMVTELPVMMPIGSRDYHVGSDREVLKPIKDMDDDELAMYMSPESIEIVRQTGSIDFNALDPRERQSLLAYRLFDSIAESRDNDARMQADERNRKFIESKGEILTTGDFVHSTGSVQSLRLITSNGLMCGETIGRSSKKDSFPYNVDFVEMKEPSSVDFSERVDGLWNKGFGSICVVMRRDENSTDYKKDTQGHSDTHRLIFGGVPSTEIAGIVMRDADSVQIEEVNDAIVDGGMYIPVYDDQGKLVLTPDEFDIKRRDANYDTVKPELVDSSFKREGTQSGSNDGAWFMMPGRGGPEHWYVKFGDMNRETADHVWTELMADELYRQVNPDLVPETKAIMVEGRFARASQQVDVDEGATVTNDARNEGAVMDWYLGNWDAVYNSANLVMTTDGKAMRIDMGNSVDFRARGGKKSEGSFGLTVAEAEYGSNNSELGGGMRQMYPGLTDEQIRDQTRQLVERLTDEQIDRIVDSVRRSSKDRSAIKETLKSRRDDLARRFLGAPVGAVA